MPIVRITTSAILSTAGLLSPWYGAYWIPGCVFGVLVVWPLARQSGRRFLGATVALLSSLLAWFAAVFCYLASQGPPIVPWWVWMFAMGATGATMLAVASYGMTTGRAWKRIVTAACVGGAISAVIALGWRSFPASGWRWVVQMAVTFAGWQWAVARTLTPDHTHGEVSCERALEDA